MLMVFKEDWGCQLTRNLTIFMKYIVTKTKIVRSYDNASGLTTFYKDIMIEAYSLKEARKLSKKKLKTWKLDRIRRAK